ncbi:hypothetical protein BJ965_001060 [Streptomyces luteogriseus]|uniref:Uncharacterized protein n=1 Tax=Streptomyces luteogriseus TaxID=68233 RepID=A0A7W7DIR5_9ACTN|nr:hypothetical protein [Streptomyces luteogriseus]MBB4711178.1 hypothetical protein [Streptomyces luteogriseus]
MTRDQALQQARYAALRAHDLATEAERLARHEDFRPKAPAFAAAGTVWANTAQAYAAIGAALPETAEEPTHG